MSDAQVFEDSFNINSINNEKYDRVSRIYATSTDNTISMSLDINHELFQVQVDDQITLVLATTLNLDGTKDEKGWRETRTQDPSLADMFDYVLYGKIYRFEDSENDTAKAFVSFGGLLLYLEGPYKKLTGLRIDQVYLLIKK
ncbi:DNA-directed RNA polymerase-like proteines i [Dendryphion nanum]|uniref:DNA-directed RNA polymerases I, II, and III subunit RPABC3 n=1 Tax=Dendryphion nanum TaxID=256645 RepID=A0A9P9DBI4_9PLEO|nr:DNA-directed RNA polymerase-like proteines i [Dendryphion nanum]